MFDHKSLDAASRLMPKMAETLGIDLDEYIMRGTLTPDDLNQAITRCAGCRDTVSCRQWLAEHADGSEAAPAYCRNKSGLEGLRREGGS